VAVPATSNGNVWDPWKGRELADILVTDGSGAKAQCNDARSCTLNVKPTGPALQLTIVDADSLEADDPIGAGICKLGKSCTLGMAKVTISRC